MKRAFFRKTFIVGTLLASCAPIWAGQAPGKASDADVPVSHRDRVYVAEQFSNTVSVTDPVDNKLLGVIRLGDPQPANLSPLYRGQVLVHGMGFSPDHKTVAVVSIGTNSITFIDTATNATKHVTYLGRAPHEAFFTPDGSEVWVTVRGEDYVAVLHSRTFEEKTRIKVPAGPGMTIFSPDGMYGYVCSSFNPETVVISIADHQIVGHVKQDSPFCPNIAATPDGKQVWMTLKDVGRTQVFDARPPFAVLRTLDTGRSPTTSTSCGTRTECSPTSPSAPSTKCRFFAQTTSARSQPYQSASSHMEFGLRAMEHVSTLGLRMVTAS
jgi:DNA-binding beta-propeller fold protein YncE